MAKKTINYGFDLPSYNETADIELLNNNTVNIDAELKKNENNTGEVADDLAAHLAETVQDTDVTYTVGPGCDFETIQAALDSLRKTRITSSATVTISVAAGVHNHTAQINITHPNGDRIQIIGADPITTTASAVGTITGGAGNYSVPVTVASVAGMQVGQYAILRNTTGTGDHECLQGIWEITGIAGSVVTLKNTFQGAAFPAVTLTGGDFVVLTTTLQFTGCNGFYITSSLGLLNNVVLIGVNAADDNSGMYVIRASVQCGSNFGASGFVNGVMAIFRGGASIAPGAAFCGNTSAGLKADQMAGLIANRAVCNGNNVFGALALSQGNMNLTRALACGNTADGFRVEAKSSLNALNAKAKHNVKYGFIAIDASAIYAVGSEAKGNGTTDYMCRNASYIKAYSLVGSPTLSPALDTVGNKNSIIASL